MHDEEKAGDPPVSEGTGGAETATPADGGRAAPAEPAPAEAAPGEQSGS